MHEDRIAKMWFAPDVGVQELVFGPDLFFNSTLTTEAILS